MKAEILITGAGVLLSLLFSYIPGLASWYKPLSDTLKRLFMLGMILLVSLGLLLLAYFELAPEFGIDLSFDREGFIALGYSFILALVANQSTYSISPRVGLNNPERYQ